MFEVIVYKTLGDASAENFENNNTDNFKQTFSFISVIIYSFTSSFHVQLVLHFKNKCIATFL